MIVVEISHGNKFTEALKICALANASDDKIGLMDLCLTSREKA